MNETCSMIKKLIELKIPKKKWEDICYICYTKGGCLLGILHEEVEQK